MNDIPVSTQWTLDAAGEAGRTAVKSVFMIVNPRTASKGSGFLLRVGYVVTNEHVVRDCRAEDVTAISSLGNEIRFSRMIVDSNRDLAILLPANPLGGGLRLASSTDLQVGTAVSAWGFPLGYNGPAPLLSVGYLAGFIEHHVGSKPKKHLVVNGAFNPGNSGGPLFAANDDKVIGVVVSKHAPISQFHQAALDVLANNRTGVVFTATDEKGNKTTYVESQIVADLLFYFRNLIQVMIGEAVAVSELKDFLKENRISLPKVK